MKILLILLNILFNNMDIDRTQYGVWCELVNQDAFYPDIATKISWTETHCGNTGVGYTKNNLFGFRDSTGGLGYQYFKSRKECISYFKRWENKYYPKFIEKTGKTDYWELFVWKGWKTGKPYSAKEWKYIAYAKKIQLNF